MGVSLNGAQEVRYLVLAKTATFLGVTGTLQSQEGVVHLVADQP